MRKPDTSQDDTAIGADKVKRGLSKISNLDIVDGGVQAVGGTMEVGKGIVGEGVGFVKGLF